MNTYRLKIDGMGCAHCVSKVTRILKESGFEVVSVEMENAKIKTDMTPSTAARTSANAQASVASVRVSMRADDSVFVILTYVGKIGPAAVR